jgi:DNA-binding transcriptional MerR regulator
VDVRRWRVGELAEATGVTVRTLHHFDEIGLVPPGERSPIGHRLYTPEDVVKLYRVLALRELGLPLGEIPAALDGELTTVIRDHLADVDRRLDALRRLRNRLAGLVSAAPSADELIATMEAIVSTGDRHVERARERHREPGFAMADWKARAARLSEILEGEVFRGTDPADPVVQALARDWREIVRELSGGDASIAAMVYQRIEVKGAEAATKGAVSSSAWELLRRAILVGYTAF